MKINRNDQKGPSFPRKSLEASEQATDAVTQALKGQTKTEATKSMSQRSCKWIKEGTALGGIASRATTATDRVTQRVLRQSSAYVQDNASLHRKNRG